MAMLIELKVRSRTTGLLVDCPRMQNDCVEIPRVDKHQASRKELWSGEADPLTNIVVSQGADGPASSRSWVPGRVWNIA